MRKATAKDGGWPHSADDDHNVVQNLTYADQSAGTEKAVSPEKNDDEPTTPKKAKPLRMTVDFPAATVVHLDAIKEKMGAASYAEVLRTALRLYAIIVEVIASGGKITIVEKDGQSRQLLVA